MAASYSTAPAADTIDVTARVSADKIWVLGGNGFVGSAVCRAAIAEGFQVVSLNRSGPPPYTEPWVDEATWIRGDVFTTTWDAAAMAGVVAVVSCLGGFSSSNEAMERINGDATISAVNGLKGSGVGKFVFVSVHDYNLPQFALDNGYFNGKRRAEARVLSSFPGSGVVLRPGFIYGKRRVGKDLEIPLDAVGRPLERLLEVAAPIARPLAALPASDLLLAPPVSVGDVALAAVRAAADENVFGILNIQQIKDLAR